ncbi:MAG: hypothetical protein KDC34_12415 [Saprospiraceae bacterium]|nr:hypothetical protein [Saprospiraceae bacterium]
MKLISSSVIILLLPFIYAAVPVNSGSTVQDYCNERFGYCMEYPEDIFTQEFFPDNGDGVLLISTDNMTRLRVSGSYNVLDWTMKDIYYFTFEDKTRENSKMQNIDSDLGENEFEATFVVGKTLQYVHGFKQADSYIILSIEVPVSDSERLTNLKDLVTLSFNA